MHFDKTYSLMSPVLISIKNPLTDGTTWYRIAEMEKYVNQSISCAEDQEEGTGSAFRPSQHHQRRECKGIESIGS